MQAVIQFDVAAFRAAFTPAFDDNATYTIAALQQYWNNAINYISPVNYGWLIGAARQQALNLMTAHLANISSIIAGGQTPGIVKEATIDKVSVSLVPPPGGDQFHWWLNITPYGQQLLALLKLKSTGGLFAGGSPVRAAFNRCWNNRGGWC